MSYQVIRAHPQPEGFSLFSYLSYINVIHFLSLSSQIPMFSSHIQSQTIFSSLQSHSLAHLELTFFSVPNFYSLQVPVLWKLVLFCLNLAFICF